MTVDPKNWSDGDKSQKNKVQRERQQMALLLTKQVTSLLQRTRLNITVTCQFLHAKKSRHMLLGEYKKLLSSTFSIFDVLWAYWCQT